jgi:antitoxin Phd
MHTRKQLFARGHAPIALAASRSGVHCGGEVLGIVLIAIRRGAQGCAAGTGAHSSGLTAVGRGIGGIPGVGMRSSAQAAGVFLLPRLARLTSRCKAKSSVRDIVCLTDYKGIDQMDALLFASLKTEPWQLQTAKAKLSELVDAAARGQPQRITRRGKSGVVVVSEQAFAALQSNAKRESPDFVSFLLSMPKGGDSNLFSRAKVKLRDISL